jgi:hypothetical protein
VPLCGAPPGPSRAALLSATRPASASALLGVQQVSCCAREAREAALWGSAKHAARVAMRAPRNAPHAALQPLGARHDGLRHDVLVHEVARCRSAAAQRTAGQRSSGVCAQGGSERAMHSGHSGRIAPQLRAGAGAPGRHAAAAPPQLRSGRPGAAGCSGCEWEAHRLERSAVSPAGSAAAAPGRGLARAAPWRRARRARLRRRRGAPEPALSPAGQDRRGRCASSRRRSAATARHGLRPHAG